MERETRSELVALGLTGVAILAIPALRYLDRENCEPAPRTINLSVGEETNIRGITVEQTKDQKVVIKTIDHFYDSLKIRFDNTSVTEIRPKNYYPGDYVRRSLC